MMRWRWLDRLRAHQLRKALYWMERRRQFAIVHGRTSDAEKHAANIAATRYKIAQFEKA